MPEQIILGITPVHLDDPDFAGGMESGMECYFSEESPTQPRSAHDLFAVLTEAIMHDGAGTSDGLAAPPAFRMGFAFGGLCGLFHPELVNADTRLTWVEALSAQCVAQQKTLAVAS